MSVSAKLKDNDERNEVREAFNRGLQFTGKLDDRTFSVNFISMAA